MAKYVIFDGDIYNYTTLENDSMFILNGGSANQTSVLDQSYLTVSNGGRTGNTYVSSGGTMNILKGGSADYACIYDYGRLVVSKGGFLERTDINGCGSAVVCKGGIVNSVGVSAGGIAMLSGTVISAGAYDDGQIEICGGEIGSALVGNYGSLILSKGTVNSATVYNTLDVYKGGTINNFKLQGGTMTLYGGTVNDASLTQDSYIYVYKGATASVIQLQRTNMTLFGGTLNVATLKDYSYLYLYKGATANNVTVNAGCSMTFFGGKATGVAVQDNDARIEICGGSVNGLTVNYGKVYATSGGKLKDVTVDEGGIVEIDDATASNLTLLNGGIEVSNGGKLINATLSNGEMNVYSGAIVSKITAENCDMYLKESAAKANGVTVKNGAGLSIYENAVANNVTVETGGCAKVTGTINGLTIGSGTSVGLYKSATATKVKWTPGDGNVMIDPGASVKYTSKYSGVYVGAAGSHVSRTNLFEESLGLGESAYVVKGGSANAVEMGGMMEVWSGGKATDTLIKGGCSMTVSSGGTVYGTKVGGYLHLSGGSASGVTIEKGGCIHIGSGTATAVEWTPFDGELSLGTDGHVSFTNELTGVYTGPGCCVENVEGGNLAGTNDSMYVMSGACANNVKIGYGSMFVFGGSVNGTVFTADMSFDGGMMILYDNASATNTVVNCGVIEVYSGAAAEHTTVSNPLGYLTIYSDGSAVDTSIEKGGVHVSSGGYADIVKAEAGAAGLFVYDGGTANHVSAGSGGYMQGGIITVSRGAVVSNLVLERGAVLFVEKGAKVVNISSSYGSYIAAEKGATVKIKEAIAVESEDSDGDGKNGWKNKTKKTVYDSLLDSKATEIDINTNAIKVDEKDMKDYNYDNFVGYGDEIDFIKIHLDRPAKLSFTIEATDAAKFTIWRWDDKKEKMVSLQSTKLKDVTGDPDYGKQYFVETKEFLLTETESDYYISVESTNASKGGNAYYNVFVNGLSTFYNKGDHSDDWPDLAEKGPNSTLYGNVGMISGADVLVENNWVGFDDGIDYMTFMVKDDVCMSFSITADEAVKFTVYSVYDNEEGGWDTVTLLTKTVKPKKAGTEKTEFTAECQFSGDLEKTYFFSVEYLNKKKVGSGANYSVYVETYDLLTVPEEDDDPGFIDIQPFEPGDDSNGCALTMPETDGLAMTDSLNFGQYDADVLADAASASALADLDGKSVWQDALLA